MRFCSWSTHRNTFYSLLLSSHLFEPDIFCVLFVHSRGQERNSDPRNKGPEFGLMNNFLYLLNFYAFIFYRIACNYFFILTIFILTVHGLQFSRTRRESKSRYWARNAALFVNLFTNHFCRGWGRDGGYTTFPTVRMVLGGGVLGWPCGRAGNPVGIYTHP